MPKIKGKLPCKRCAGMGCYKYDHNHSTVCGLCCTHSQGFWPLTKHYQGYSDGDRWCCKAGCGYSLPFNPEEKSDEQSN